ncbi:MAG: apolipoprotein N-acyltransferase [Bacteroidia bacterium]|nr:apolipoprotein N-acyltransferase [Bacteroidia bacterium]
MEKWWYWWQVFPTSHPYKAAFLAGLLLGVAFPPFSLPWTAWIGWLMIWRLSETHISYRFAYLSLLVWNIVGCYWLTLTALSAPNLKEALISFLAGTAAILLNPLLMLIPFILWKKGSRLVGITLSPWLFVALWIVFEEFHFRWELSWSWLTLGFIWSEWSFWAKLASWWGPVGLSGWTLVGSALLWKTLNRNRLLLFLGWSVGLPLLNSLTQNLSDVQLAASREVWVLQPNIDPYAKFSELPPELQVRRLLELLPKAPSIGTLILGPETVIPLAVNLEQWREDPLLQPFLRYAERYQVNILLGIVAVRYFPPGSLLTPSASLLPDGRSYESYNAALLIRPDTAMIHIKGRLVPFVERVPYLETLEFLREWQIDLGGGFGNFGKPPVQTPLLLYPDNLPVAVAVCYESIFAHDLRRRLPSQPALIAIMTNDGWWKRSSGHWQHYTYARLTCVSLGVPAARSANTGISALINAEGIPMSYLPYGSYGRATTSLTPQTPSTLYYHKGEAGAFLLITFALSIWLIQWWQSRLLSTSSEK